MAETLWYRSLYWRIAAGFVGTLAVLLAAQVVVFLWVSGRAAEFWPGRTPAEYAQVIAADVSAALAERPDLDLDAHVNGRFTSPYRAFAIVMRDRTAVYGRRVPPPPMIARAALLQLGVGPAEERGRGGRGRGGRPGPGDGRPQFVFAPVLVNGEVAGTVAVSLSAPPLRAAVASLGPALALQAFLVLCVGAVLVSLLVFHPARRRLVSLQAAVRAFGDGRSDVRAPEDGGDEVAALAKAFNRMATTLEHRAAALADADRSRRQLLADVSHELGTPLAAIRGYVETLGMPDVELDGATRQRYLGIVSMEAERLGHIIDDLLDLARFESGGVPLRVSEVPVASLFQRVADRHAPVLQDRQVTLEPHLSPAEMVVVADPTRLEQVLQNLVANAIRHSPVGGCVQLTAEREEDVVRFRVDDDGPGIAAEHLPRVFDRFYKVDASRTGTSVPSGSGLGLSIVRAIVEQHGGRVSAENRLRGGASFTVELPDARPDTPASQ